MKEIQRPFLRTTDLFGESDIVMYIKLDDEWSIMADIFKNCGNFLNWFETVIWKMVPCN